MRDYALDWQHIARVGDARRPNALTSGDDKGCISPEAQTSARSSSSKAGSLQSYRQVLDLHRQRPDLSNGTDKCSIFIVKGCISPEAQTSAPSSSSKVGSLQRHRQVLDLHRPLRADERHLARALESGGAWAQKLCRRKMNRPKPFRYTKLFSLSDSLWSPYVIGQTIIFSSCRLLFFFFRVSFFHRLISAAAQRKNAPIQITISLNPS